MSTNYDDMFDSSTIAETTHDDESFHVTKWKLGKHSASPSLNAAELRNQAARQQNLNDELSDVFNQAAELVEEVKLKDFQCPVCGLSHGHSDTKHDIRESFNVTNEFAERMEFAPNCHCGVNELAMLMDFYGEIVMRVFEDDEEFVPFESLMPSHEADHALSMMADPSVTVVEKRNTRAGQNRAAVYTTAQVLNESNLQSDEDTVRSFTLLYNRISNIRTAAEKALIPSEVESRINTIRTQLESDFDDE